MNQNTLIGIVAVISLAVGLWLAATISPSAVPPKYVQLYPVPRALAPVTITDHQGNQITNEWFKDQWTLIFMGYTFCPDICPTTLAELKQLYPQLQSIEAKHPVKVLFLSVDPNRDTQERLNEYINFFHSDFVAATAEHKALFPFVRSMGMAYAIAESTDKPDYLIDHSASVVVVNPNGHVMGRFKPEHKPGEMPISDGEQIMHDLPLIAAAF